jgi:hypothetical protein
MVMEVLLLHNMVKAFLFWVALKYGIEYTHHPMHCMQCTSQHSSAECACVLRTTERNSYQQKLAWLRSKSQRKQQRSGSFQLIRFGQIPLLHKELNTPF